MLKVSAHGAGNLLECLRLEDLLPESPCNGKGICGKCRVRVLSGDVSPLTEQEKKRVLEDAHRKSSKDGFFDHCGADCAEECCECIEDLADPTAL